jgi:hypothetical protein
MKRSPHLTNLALLSAGMIIWVLGCTMPPPSPRGNILSANNAPASSDTPGSTISNWAYDEYPDKMGRGTVRTASTTSTNTVSFDFPYSGEQHATLTLRSHPEHGKDVILRIERGQFLTGIEGCTVTLRFDDSPPMKLHGNEPADLSTNVLFIEGFERVAGNLERAKKLKIEAPFYQEGNQVFEFDVQGFTREKLSPKKAK